MRKSKATPVPGFGRVQMPIPPITLPFGRHKGEPIGDVPSQYLKWFFRLPDLLPETWWNVKAELERRETRRIARELAQKRKRAMDLLLSEMRDTLQSGRMDDPKWQEYQQKGASILRVGRRKQ